ncbi:sensor histidine kinase [Geothrix fuzhouensis]|uniref:sensor histidine kinase n=1 Tax=Geothrix fuzhouensis TaxID=2966451 RepID=UPI002147EC8C|nr:HAMP domain-containing sensor histidine kinase [Geothrix fuzhouensis]
MNSDGPFPIQSRSNIPPRHGFTESLSENMLRDSVLIAAALTGAQVALVLQDEIGTWYRDGSGLTSEQLAGLEPADSQGLNPESKVRLLEKYGLLVVEALPLVDDRHLVIGTLCALSPEPLALSEVQREGLRLLAEHIQIIVAMDHQKSESRTTPRAPSAASFVPGLVHELGSFIFGISASLDAFEARFADVEGMSKYGANIRRSLDRMSAFIVELREYGYPQRLSWTVLALEPLLQEAIEHNLPLAVKNGLDLQLHIEGPLPAINADKQGLQSAFTRMINLVLQHEEPGGHVVLHVASSHPGNRTVVSGHLEFSSAKMENIDTARLFEPFYFRVSGMGRLTLPGARRVFESHGGTLTAGPGAEGRMRISFMLPSELSYSLRAASQP